MILDQNALLDRHRSHLESALEDTKKNPPPSYDCLPKKKKKKFDINKNDQEPKRKVQSSSHLIAIK